MPIVSSPISAPMWEAMKFWIPTALSGSAFYLALKDRRPRLSLKPRKGDWYALTPSSSTGQVIFKGVVELYNYSSRANAVREYRFLCKQPDGTWREMESERYKVTMFMPASEKEETETYNVTPLSLAPYSGIDVPVRAVVTMPSPDELKVIVEVEDLFGSSYRTEVIARA